MFTELKFIDIAKVLLSAILLCSCGNSAKKESVIDSQVKDNSSFVDDVTVTSQKGVSANGNDSLVKDSVIGNLSGFDFVRFSVKKTFEEDKNVDSPSEISVSVDFPVATSGPRQLLDSLQSKIQCLLRLNVKDGDIRRALNDYVNDVGADMHPVEEGEVGNVSYLSFEVKNHTEQLMVFCVSSYVFLSGSAHGLPSEIYKVYDINKMCFLKNEDIFSPGSEDSLRKLIRSKLLKSDVSLFDRELKSLRIPSNILVAKDGLTFFYDVYELAPYCDGFVSAKCSPEEISSFIQNESVKKVFEK